MKLPDCLAGVPVMTELPEFLPDKTPPYPEGGDGYHRNYPDRDSNYPHRNSRARRVTCGNQAASGLQQVHLSPFTHRWVQMAQNSIPSLRKCVMLFWSTGISAFNEINPIVIVRLCVPDTRIELV